VGHAAHRVAAGDFVHGDHYAVDLSTSKLRAHKSLQGQRSVRGDCSPRMLLTAVLLEIAAPGLAITHLATRREDSLYAVPVTC
jgi:hypothetical protein